MMRVPPHDDRKGHHYYIRMRGPAKPEYSSDDPCGHHVPLRSSCALAVIMCPCGHHVPLRSSCGGTHHAYVERGCYTESVSTRDAPSEALSSVLFVVSL